LGSTPPCNPCSMHKSLSVARSCSHNWVTFCETQYQFPRFAGYDKAPSYDYDPQIRV
jgi:hypothetical protein